MTAPAVVELGHVLVGLIQPHTGYEQRFHRWYERDHLYRAGKAAPGTIGASLWVAPPDLRTLREPAGANAISGSAEAGSHLSTDHGQLQAETGQWVRGSADRAGWTGTAAVRLS